MTKYHPGDKVTVKAIVRHNCLCPDLLGVVIGDVDNARQTIVINVDEIVSHEAPLRVGDRVKFVDKRSIATYEVLSLYKDAAWIVNINSGLNEPPFTLPASDLERV